MYFDIYCKNLDMSEDIRSLVDEKLGHLDQLLQDYPADSLIGKVNLLRLPMSDEYYNIRVLVTIPGSALYARETGAPLDAILTAVAAELEHQLKHVQSGKRNEGHWKRLRRRPDTVRRTVPVNDDEVPDIADEVRRRTEEAEAKGRRKVA